MILPSLFLYALFNKSINLNSHLTRVARDKAAMVLVDALGQKDEYVDETRLIIILYKYYQFESYIY